VNKIELRKELDDKTTETRLETAWARPVSVAGSTIMNRSESCRIRPRIVSARVVHNTISSGGTKRHKIYPRWIYNEQ
jgi:hypothetical protein